MLPLCFLYQYHPEVAGLAPTQQVTRRLEGARELLVSPRGDGVID